MAMEMVKIDKRFIMPARSPNGGRRMKYPWLRINVGESFLIESKNLRNARSLVYKAQVKYKRMFTTETRPGGLRVWRVE